MNEKIKKYNAVIRIRSDKTGIIKERGFVDIDAMLITGCILSCFSVVKWQGKKKRDGLFHLSLVSLAEPVFTVNGHIFTSVPVKPEKDIHFIAYAIEKQVGVFGFIYINKSPFYSDTLAIIVYADNNIALHAFVFHFFKLLFKIYF